MPKQLVLAGLGHTHLLALRAWAKRPLPDARIVCVSDFAESAYSAMLSGTVAGEYQPDQMRVPLEPLCAAAGAELVVGRVEAFDVANRQVRVAGRAPLPFDILSIGIGSMARPSGMTPDDPRVVPIKPMQSFVARLDQACRQAGATGGRPLDLVIAGGGAGGLELACCLPPDFAGRSRRVTLVTRHEPGRGLSARASRLLEHTLRKKGVVLYKHAEAVGLTADGVQLADGRVLPMQVLILATEAIGSPLLAESGLETDSRGFLRIRPTLQVVTEAPVFAVGDCGSLVERHTPKAGVFAVREAPILTANVGRLLSGQPLRKFRPQKHFLKLLNTGDGRAVLSYRWLGFHGRWCRRWKERLDDRFMSQFRSPASAEM